MATISGGLPDLRRGDLPPCRFSARCDRHDDACERDLPRIDIAARHMVACHHPL
jgi:ABC-type dipeptide/oligopeptide/nickel transport system ATPase component